MYIDVYGARFSRYVDPNFTEQPDPVRESILNHPSPQARLVCLYLERVPGAYETDLRRDLAIDQQTLSRVLRSLLDRGSIEKRGRLYILSLG